MAAAEGGGADQPIFEVSFEKKIIVIESRCFWILKCVCGFE